MEQRFNRLGVRWFWVFLPTNKFTFANPDEVIYLLVRQGGEAIYIVAPDMHGGRFTLLEQDSLVAFRTVCFVQTVSLIVPCVKTFWAGYGSHCNAQICLLCIK